MQSDLGICNFCLQLWYHTKNELDYEYQSVTVLGTVESLMKLNAIPEGIMSRFAICSR